jgi:hypothetical protein
MDARAYGCGVEIAGGSPLVPDGRDSISKGNSLQYLTLEENDTVI